MEGFALRLERVEREVERLSVRAQSSAIARACVDEKLSSILATLAELKEGMQRLQNLPARRWETLISALISAVCALAAGLLLGRGM